MSVLPLEPVLVQSEDEVAVLRTAVDLLTERCMAESGYSFTPYPLEPVVSPIAVALRYGAISVDQAEQFGYLNPDAEERRAFDGRVAAIDRDRPQSPDYLEALYGTVSPSADGGLVVGELGCVAVAESEIYGQPGAFAGTTLYEDLIQLQLDSGSELYATDEAQAVMAAWSDCMVAAGYRFTSWWDAPQQFPISSDDLPPPPPEMRSTALQDAECRAETRLEAELFRIEDRLLAQIMDDNAALISEYQELVAEAAARAAAVVGSPPPGMGG